MIYETNAGHYEANHHFFIPLLKLLAKTGDLLTVRVVQKPQCVDTNLQAWIKTVSPLSSATQLLVLFTN